MNKQQANKTASEVDERWKNLFDVVIRDSKKDRRWMVGTLIVVVTAFIGTIATLIVL